MTTPFGSLEEVRAALGTPLGPTPWLPVHQDWINEFGRLTGDQQWIHTDPDRAASGPFGTTIAHGFLTLSLVPQFGAQLFRLEFGSARVNYGLNRVRFPAPVPVDARVRAAAEFRELSPSGAGHQLTTQYTIELEGSAKPACVAETLTLLLP
ncbi:MaoC family dehydratase [Actinocorallia sp. API 0066]|uniref:MaoC family dehydratase n=1 Tax=Actinocorallia sp. API 0066 TaxID=2896846 RepID=UPI001E519311|nr:MaoC family dehydratase [Actinocorallia sp. API 0066]MCD0449134.1 MaoC family dehydratase [Actinocorallia sp. API 0066]